MKQISSTEPGTRMLYEELETEDAEIIIAAYGISASYRKGCRKRAKKRELRLV